MTTQPLPADDDSAKLQAELDHVERLTALNFMLQLSRPIVLRPRNLGGFIFAGHSNHLAQVSHAVITWLYEQGYIGRLPGSENLYLTDAGIAYLVAEKQKRQQAKQEGT